MPLCPTNFDSYRTFYKHSNNGHQTLISEEAYLLNRLAEVYSFPHLDFCDETKFEQRSELMNFDVLPKFKQKNY